MVGECDALERDHGPRRHGASVREQLEKVFPRSESVDRLVSYLEPMDVRQGDYLVRQGSPAERSTSSSRASSPSSSSAVTGRLSAYGRSRRGR